MDAIVEVEVATFGVAVKTEVVFTIFNRVLNSVRDLAKTSTSTIAPTLLMIRNSLVVNGPNPLNFEGGRISAA